MVHSFGRKSLKEKAETLVRRCSLHNTAQTHTYTLVTQTFAHYSKGPVLWKSTTGTTFFTSNYIILCKWVS